MNILYNNDEKRLRAGVRIALQTVMLFAAMIGFSLIVNLLALKDDVFHIASFCVAITISVWLSGRYLDKRPFADFGMRLNSRFWTHYFVGWLITAVMQLFVVATYAWSGTLDSIETPRWENLSTAPFWLLFLSMLMVGYHEELWSRGYHLLNMTEGFTGWKISPHVAAMLSIVISSTFFALMHVGNPNVTTFALINIALAGIWLALPFLITGSLGLSIGMHTGWNFVMGAVFGMPISGQQQSDEAILWKVKTNGPAWFTGGDFGPEGGVVASLALLLGTVLMLVYLRSSGVEAHLHSVFLPKPPALDDTGKEPDFSVPLNVKP
jgi:membrane protease YdiL (CAAX protease family)